MRDKCKSRSFGTFWNLISSQSHPAAFVLFWRLRPFRKRGSPGRSHEKCTYSVQENVPACLLRGYGADELGISLTRIVTFNFKPETLWLHFVRVLNYSALPHIYSESEGRPRVLKNIYIWSGLSWFRRGYWLPCRKLRITKNCPFT